MAADKQKRVTLRDVAQTAGVSLKTASNVINGSGRMSAATRQKVQAVIDELGYQVNVAARNLTCSNTGVITLAVPTLTPPYLAELANRVIDSARLHGYSVYVTTYAEGNTEGLQELLRGFNTTVSDGMILSLSEVAQFSPDELRVSYPLVCVGARDTGGVVDHVTPNDTEAGATAAAYLLDRGSARLAVVGARADYSGGFDAVCSATEGNAELRLRGIIEECARHAAPLLPQLIGNTGADWTIGSGFHTTERLIAAGEPFDGIVALNDQLAIGVIAALTAAQIDIPKTVQVIGFDDIEEAEYLQQPLTTMASCLEWVASTSVERILGRIGGRIHAPELLETFSYVIPRATTR
ncbi:LacI family transcriptional regulator [Bifidobacterium pseudolongum subsp. globosum]|uniref:LacI family transcriptional regulator n=1 Tax=Bifidobacterium pseudolongum subsp. globosum TaxID=1690 RepID=A0A4Q5AKI6_9BIFI|nr:LacI family DNA-binding transcriptional regulator [Bifidobacterium pseudolongum]RYQ21115.1 LacI family transcriptional regulator [Bifidobacterium pseudolongum subsp. globosum]RYQ29525.1 LacI family transcriptional regulator [Bifidobacterium pseudolongum subsp. globosum]